MSRFFLFLVAVVVVLGLYSFAGTSDQMDGLTLQQQERVVSRWGGR